MIDVLTSPTLLDLHRLMVRIRLFEDAAGRLSESGEIPGPVHLYSGQEAVAVGVMSRLTQADHITSTHRGHGHLIAKGGDVRRMMAELFGRSDGYCQGKGGSMHMCDPSLGMLGSNGIVGAGSGIAIGAAFTHQYRADGHVSVSFFGDGATTIGAFHEAVNMAAVLTLPCVFVCENNLYGEFTPQRGQMLVNDVAERAAGYGIPGIVVDGMDVEAVTQAATVAIDRARAGNGPTLLECKTYRFHSHAGRRNSGPDYRDAAEEELWRARDPITLAENVLLGRQLATPEVLATVRADVQAEIDDALAFAEASPWPEAGELLTNVYVNSSGFPQ